MGRENRFTTEFKRGAVRLALTSGRPRREIAEDLGIGLSSLGRWVGQFRNDDTTAEINNYLEAEPRRFGNNNAVFL